MGDPNPFEKRRVRHGEPIVPQWCGVVKVALRRIPEGTSTQNERMYSGDHHIVSQPLYSPPPSQLSQPNRSLDPRSRSSSRPVSLASANQKAPTSQSSIAHTLPGEDGHKHQVHERQKAPILAVPPPGRAQGTNVRQPYRNEWTHSPQRKDSSTPAG